MRQTLVLALLLAGCGRLEQVGRAPDFSPIEGSFEHHAIYAAPFPEVAEGTGPGEVSSLWTSGSESLLGDRRAAARGDILTVVIEIDDSAEISNSTDRSRSGQERMNIPSLFGIPERVQSELPEGASLAEAVNTSGSASYSGDGSVSRNERLTLRIAATVVEELPNGVLRIEGQQEVRVNNELRELMIAGFVRPNDISRQNEITYDKIAGARISYGGRGLITDVQQPRYGQQIVDAILPF
jgi:flagellar L-ring protein precursor FlgH